jgi:hypothetical protein
VEISLQEFRKKYLQTEMRRKAMGLAGDLERAQ